MAFVRKIPLIYAGLCVLACILFVAGLPMFAGENADPLSGIFMFLLGLPWILVLDVLGELGTWATALLSIVAMAINFLILRKLLNREAKEKGESPG